MVLELRGRQCRLHTGDPPADDGICVSWKQVTGQAPAPAAATGATDMATDMAMDMDMHVAKKRPRPVDDGDVLLDRYDCRVLLTTIPKKKKWSFSDPRAHAGDDGMTGAQLEELDEARFGDLAARLAMDVLMTNDNPLGSDAAVHGKVGDLAVESSHHPRHGAAPHAEDDPSRKKAAIAFDYGAEEDKQGEQADQPQDDGHGQGTGNGEHDAATTTDDQKEAETLPPPDVQVTIPEHIPVPADPKAHQVMDKTARFIVKKDKEGTNAHAVTPAELYLRNRHAQEPAFAFLTPSDRLHSLFRFMLKTWRTLNKAVPFPETGNDKNNHTNTSNNHNNNNNDSSKGNHDDSGDNNQQHVGPLMPLVGYDSDADSDECSDDGENAPTSRTKEIVRDMKTKVIAGGQAVLDKVMEERMLAPEYLFLHPWHRGHLYYARAMKAALQAWKEKNQEEEEQEKEKEKEKEEEEEKGKDDGSDGDEGKGKEE